METVFSKQLQMLRKQSGITQEQLADKLGVTAQAVSKWENGSYPDGDLLPKIADIFDVSDCRKTPICKQVGVKFMPNYAFEWKLRSITAKNEKNMRFLQLWIAYFLRFIATNLSLTQFVT